MPISLRKSHGNWRWCLMQDTSYPSWDVKILQNPNCTDIANRRKKENAKIVDFGGEKLTITAKYNLKIVQIHESQMTGEFRNYKFKEALKND